MNASKATIGGFAILASANVEWRQTSGVRPYEAIFDMRPEDAQQLVNGPLAPVELILGDVTTGEIPFRFLYVVARSPGPEPGIARVRVVDRRWFWSSKHVVKRYNMRRVHGGKRQKDPGTPPEIQPVADDVTYAPFSLDGGRPWTAERAIEDLLRGTVFQSEQDAVGIAPTLRLSPAVGGALSNLPIEDVELDDPGDQAVMRMLRYLPEADVTVDPDGSVRIYSRASGGERFAVVDAGPESDGGGHVEFISMARYRPRRVRVLFTREHEIRFDFEEPASKRGTAAPMEDLRRIQNVLPVPDWSLVVAGRDVAQGTWITFPEALKAWGAPPRLGRLDYDDIRRAMIPYMDLFAPLALLGQAAPNVDWMARIATILAHYRRTYRINPEWMGRILRLKAEKVATLDPTTGTRAPALVWADYSYVGSQRSMLTQAIDGADLSYAMNVKSYPPGELGAALSVEYPPAPAVVSIAAHDQGVLHFEFLGDVAGVYNTVLPGMLSVGGSVGAESRPRIAGPTADITDRARPIAMNAVIDNGAEGVTLSTPYRVAVVLSAVPASPNSSSQLFAVEMGPEDVKDILPSAYQTGLFDARGPELEVRIGATIETARVAWVDERARDIEAAFGVRDSGGQGRITDLVMNLTEDAAGAGSLNAIAKATAAQVYAMFADREMGGKTVRLTKNAYPDGWLSEVSHQIDEEGRAETMLALPPQLRGIDVFALLPASTRRIILRLAPSPDGA